jgi:hypothetical protein
MRNPQLSATVEPELFRQVEELAKKDNRSLSEMVSLLLQYAVKEKTRKRKGAKQGIQV